MTNERICEMALRRALSTFLSNFNDEDDPNEVMSAIDDGDLSKLPNGIEVWEPFEHWEASELCGIITDEYDANIRLIHQVLKEQNDNQRNN